jgi:hypothetical protein
MVIENVHVLRLKFLYILMVVFLESPEEIWKITDET